jgi:excisionase family DNA binding protein
MDSEMVTVKEAARILGTTKEKVARLVKQGILTSRPSTIDARRRLIPRIQVERILRGEGRLQSSSPDMNGSELKPRAWPRTAGMYSGPLAIDSDEVEDYLRDHWRPE